MQTIANATPGVLAAHDRRRRTSLRLGPEAGDVVVFCKAGWRFSEPDPTGNPIPGNHGHPATRPIPFFIGGGHPDVPRRRASSALARTVDVAPTVARFFGVGAPAGGTTAATGSEGPGSSAGPTVVAGDVRRLGPSSHGFPSLLA